MAYLLTDSPPSPKHFKVNNPLLSGGKGEFLGQDKKKKIKGKGGSSCHQCKSRRNDSALTYCTSNLDKKNKRCRKKFCGHCLKKFYKETPQGIPDRTTWKCPSCRKICCCAACRRRKQRDSGFAVPPTASKPKSSKKSSSHNNSHSGGGHNQRGGGEECLVPNSVPQDFKSNHHHIMHYGGPQTYGGLGSSAVPPRPDENDYAHFRNEFHTGLQPLYSPVLGAVPAVPTEAVSPIATPLNTPQGFVDFPSISLSQDNEGRGKSLAYPSLLEREIQKQAKQASQDKNNNQFAHLYSVAQTPLVRQKIHEILGGNDISQDQKVEAIAQLLRVQGSRIGQPRPPHSQMIHGSGIFGHSMQQ